MTLRREIYLVTGVVVLIVLPIIASVIISTVDKYQSLRYIQVLDKNPVILIVGVLTPNMSAIFNLLYTFFHQYIKII